MQSSGDGMSNSGSIAIDAQAGLPRPQRQQPIEVPPETAALPVDRDTHFPRQHPTGANLSWPERRAQIVGQQRARVRAMVASGCASNVVPALVPVPPATAVVMMPRQQAPSDPPLAVPPQLQQAIKRNLQQCEELMQDPRWHEEPCLAPHERGRRVMSPAFVALEQWIQAMSSESAASCSGSNCNSSAQVDPPTFLVATDTIVGVHS